MITRRDGNAARSSFNNWNPTNGPSSKLSLTNATSAVHSPSTPTNSRRFVADATTSRLQGECINALFNISQLILGSSATKTRMHDERVAADGSFAAVDKMGFAISDSTMLPLTDSGDKWPQEIHGLHRAGLHRCHTFLQELIHASCLPPKRVFTKTPLHSIRICGEAAFVEVCRQNRRPSSAPRQKF